MIRIASAWILLLLAASPMTAPFSTCDLRLFAMNSGDVQRMDAAQSASFAAHTSDDADAQSLSPLVTRSGTPQDSTSSVMACPFRLGRPAPAVPLNSRRDRSPHELGASAAVLRL